VRSFLCAQSGLEPRFGTVAGMSRMLVGTLGVRYYGNWTQLMQDKIAFVRAPTRPPAAHASVSAAPRTCTRLADWPAALRHRCVRVPSLCRS
jgi:hypothetical protein